MMNALENYLKRSKAKGFDLKNIENWYAKEKERMAYLEAENKRKDRLIIQFIAFVMRTKTWRYYLWLIAEEKVTFTEQPKQLNAVCKRFIQ